jgi:hypothetical protein
MNQACPPTGDVAALTLAASSYLSPLLSPPLPASTAGQSPRGAGGDGLSPSRSLGGGCVGSPSQKQCTQEDPRRSVRRQQHGVAAAASGRGEQERRGRALHSGEG